MGKTTGTKIFHYKRGEYKRRTNYNTLQIECIKPHRALGVQAHSAMASLTLSYGIAHTHSLSLSLSVYTLAE